MLTWCDGLADVDLERAAAPSTSAHGRLGTLTAVHPPARFGRLALAGDRVTAFREKRSDPNEWINGAFFVFDPGIFDYIDGDATQFEREPLSRLAADGELMAVPPRGLLAVHGHAEGGSGSEPSLGDGQRRPGSCGLARRSRCAFC